MANNNPDLASRGQHTQPPGLGSNDGQRSTHLPGTVVGNATAGGQVNNRSPRPGKDSSYMPIDANIKPTRTTA
jgi:hypothetical protein